MLRDMHPTVANELQRAFAMKQAGQLDAAAALCADLAMRFRNEPDVLHLFGLIRKQQGRSDEALELLQKSVDTAPGRANFHANLANLFAALGRLADAEKSYRQALGLDGSFRPARLGLARTLNQAGFHKEAAAEARMLLTANPQDAEAEVVLGVALTELHDLDDAEAAYRRALTIAPGYGAAHHNLGALLARMERLEDSLIELDAARQCGVSGHEIDFNRASTLLKLYRFEEGEALLQDLVRRAPDYADAQKLLAQYQFMRGSEAYAADLHAAVQSRPADARLQLALAQILHGANELDAAEAALTDAIVHCHEHPRLLAMLASVNQEAGRNDAALAYARRGVVADPDDHLLADFEIDALMSLGRADEAMPLIRRARQRVPNNQWYIAIEATAARLLGDPLYEVLCDYDRFVQAFELEAPSGWSSIADFHQDFVPALERRHQFYAHPLDQSLRQGTQTPRNLIGDPDPLIQAFLTSLREPIDAYRAAIGTGVNAADHPLTSRNQGEAKLTGCWSVRLQRGGFHVNHVHPQGWISSAYYAEVPSEVADEDAKSGWIKFGEPRYPVPGADAEHFVQPREGRLVLFPSYLWHGTMPIHGNEPRMTVAFDVVTSTDR